MRLFCIFAGWQIWGILRMWIDSGLQGKSQRIRREYLLGRNHGMMIGGVTSHVQEGGPILGRILEIGAGEETDLTGVMREEITGDVLLQSRTMIVTEVVEAEGIVIDAEQGLVVGVLDIEERIVGTDSTDGTEIIIDPNLETVTDLGIETHLETEIEWRVILEEKA